MISDRIILKKNRLSQLLNQYINNIRIDSYYCHILIKTVLQQTNINSSAIDKLSLIDLHLTNIHKQSEKLIHSKEMKHINTLKNF